MNRQLQELLNESNCALEEEDRLKKSAEGRMQKDNEKIMEL